MKPQSEAEWLAKHLDSWVKKTGADWLWHPALAKSILAALKRRGWRAPPKQRTKKGR